MSSESYERLAIALDALPKLGRTEGKFCVPDVSDRSKHRLWDAPRPVTAATQLALIRPCYGYGVNRAYIDTVLH